MFRAIGFLIILWGLSNFFSAFQAFDTALVAIFNVVEIGADTAHENIKEHGFQPITINPH